MPEWRKITGYTQVIAYRPQLMALAEICGQSGCMDHLEYHLCAPYISSQLADRAIWSPGASAAFSRKARRPTLLVETGPEGLTAAVLLFEHMVYGLATGVFIPLDLDGLQTVVASPARRVEVARQAAEFLLSYGARILMISLNEGLADQAESRTLLAQRLQAGTSGIPGGSTAHIGLETREVSRFLPLADTYDATLSRMGHRTRRNLRALTRHAIKDFGAAFVSNPQLAWDEYLGLSRASTFAVPDWVARWRYRSMQRDKDVMMAGLRAADGRWLSLLGARRHADTIDIDWQLNRNDSGSSSLGTVMRAFLIADEVARGTRGMRFEGGTSHSIQGAFTVECVSDFLFARGKLSLRIMRMFARMLRTGGRLQEMLLSDKVTWLSTAATRRPSS